MSSSGPLVTTLGIRSESSTKQDYSTSLGALTGDCEEGSTIVGALSSAPHRGSVALGYKAETTAPGQLTIRLDDQHILRTKLEVDTGTDTLALNVNGLDYNLPLNGGTGAGGASVASYPTFTTAGQITYAGGANDGDHLAIGTAGQVLTSTGSAPQWKSTLKLGEGGFATPAIEFGSNGGGKDGIYIPSPGYISFLASGVDQFLVQEGYGCYTPNIFSCKTLRVTNTSGGGNPAGYVLVSNGVAGNMVPTAPQDVGSTRKFNRITATALVPTLAGSDDTVNEIDYQSHNASVAIDLQHYALGANNDSHRGSRWYVGHRGSNPNTDLVFWCSTGAKICGTVVGKNGVHRIVNETTVSLVGTATGLNTGDWIEVHPMNGKIIVSGYTAGDVFVA